MNSCEEVKIASRKFPSTCYSLINELKPTEQKLQNALFLSAEQSLSHNMTISAFGFFELNRLTLSTMWSVVATYTIVIIQIHFSSKDVKNI